MNYEQLIEELREEMLQLVNTKCDALLQMYRSGEPVSYTHLLELAVLGILWYAGQIPYAYAVYTGICITALFMIVGKAQLWICLLYTSRCV